MCNDDIPFETTHPLEALWHVLTARSQRVAGLRDDRPSADDEERLWEEFEELLVADGTDAAPTLRLDIDGDVIPLDRRELVLLGATAAFALGVTDQVLGQMPLGMAALTVADAVTLLAPQTLDERLEHLRYLGGAGRLLEAGVLAVGEHDAEKNPGSLLLADVVLTGRGLRALLDAC